MNIPALLEMENEIAPLSSSWVTTDKWKANKHVSRGSSVEELVNVFVSLLSAKQVTHSEAENMVRAEFARRAIVIAGNQCGAARLLGVHRNTLRRMMGIGE